MEEITQRLKRFERRVRLVRAWRGAAVGLCVGAAASAVWAVLDWYAVIYAEWAWLGVLAAASALVGGIVAFCLRVPTHALARSIDRRAGLDDRLTTAREHGVGAELFDEPLMADASSHVESLKPAAVFPFKVGRWQAGAVALTAVAACIFLLGNTPILLNDEQKKQLDELKREGAKVERIIRENLEDPETVKDMSEEEKDLAKDLLKLKRDLEKGRMNKEQAMQRADELMKQAEKLLMEAAKNGDLALEKADSALDKMRKEAMEQVGLKNADPQLMKMSDAEREAAMEQLQSKLESLQSEMEALQSQLSAMQQKMKNPNLSAAEKKKLEEQMKELQKKLAEAQQKSKDAKDDMDALKLSKEAQEVFNKMMEHPLYKELQELAKQLAKDNQAAKQGGRPKLTKEQREELLKKMEELAKKLKDDKAMEEYLKALLEAMKQAKKLGNCNGVCMLPGAARLPLMGNGGIGSDEWAGDVGKINKLDKPTPSKGTTTPTMITGQKNESGEESYVEIKAPTNVGTRSSVPYMKVLPSYQRKAESAMNRQEIPKEHQKRVKEYFESLQGKG